MCLFIHLWRFATPEFSVPQQSPLHNPAIFSVFASSGTVTQITLLQQVAHCFLIHCNSIMSAWKAFILPAFCMCFKKRKCFLMWRQLLWNHHGKEWKCHVRIPVRDCIHIWSDTELGTLILSWVAKCQQRIPGILCHYNMAITVKWP